MVEHRREEMLEKARILRKEMTKEEKHLWYDFLKNYPVRFRKQEIIGNYIVDFYCSKAKIAVEIDGAQHYTSQSLEYDRERTKYLESCGIKTIRLLNGDINRNFENACNKIVLSIKGNMN
ncbi:MAG: endonuclease domain-containing protein [Oscillospiraceae bacterium]|nr:endonuclease domain-containing protein [Oscillospiraceae bacterium]